MCDTLVVRATDHVLFAKNSDRPAIEPQVIESFGRRIPSASLRTQYLDLADAGAAATVLARPDWLWGAEHGVNEWGVAIGNEKLPSRGGNRVDAEPSLIGMDLVRLALERSRTAAEAVETICGLVGEHGQRGVADSWRGIGYDSAFLVADRTDAWIVETHDREFVTRRVDGPGAAISNSYSLSPRIAPEDWTDPEVDPTRASRRLACTLPAALAGSATPAAVAPLLRDHGDGSGMSVCMHWEGDLATTSSMIVTLPTDGPAPIRAWFAPGSPCVSVYVPAWPTQHPLPRTLSEVAVWHRFDRLRRRTEATPSELAVVQAVMAPLEDELWAEADALDLDRVDEWNDSVDRRIDAALTGLGE